MTFWTTQVHFYYHHNNNSTLNKCGYGFTSMSNFNYYTKLRKSLLLLNISFTKCLNIFSKTIWVLVLGKTFILNSSIHDAPFCHQLQRWTWKSRFETKLSWIIIFDMTLVLRLSTEWSHRDNLTHWVITITISYKRSFKQLSAII